MIDLYTLISYGVAAFAILITAALIYARWHYGTLEKLTGLPAVEPPHFIGGSDPFFYKKVVSDEDTKLVKKHGPIFGVYESREPQIYIADPDLIRLILVRDFDHFNSHRPLNFGHPLMNEMMDVLPYKKWKPIRTYLSPQLTTGKIRSMSYQILEAVDDWLSKIKELHPQDRFTIKQREVFTALTTDVIARCAFGTKVNAFENENHEFVKNIKLLGLDDDGDDTYSPLFALSSTFPFLARLLPLVPDKVMDYFGNLLREIFQARRKQGTKHNDFVDVLNDMLDKCSTKEYKESGITENTVMAQAMLFLLAGFETTAGTLAIMTYRLAKCPEIQEKVLKEVDEYLERHNGQVDHETIGELTYVTATMNETLRMNPAVIRIERLCNKTWYDEKTGLKIPKGVTVQIPSYAVHYDPKNFPDPDVFKPERFLASNSEKHHPYAFLAFGNGPHNCMGMRFAKEEILMTVAKMFKDFKFEDPGAKLEPKIGKLFLQAYNPFELTWVRRRPSS